MVQGPDYIYKCASLNLLINVRATVSRCFQKFVLACPAVHLHSALAHMDSYWIILGQGIKYPKPRCQVNISFGI
jgi:hypothetical protein